MYKGTMYNVQRTIINYKLDTLDTLGKLELLTIKNSTKS